MKPSEFKRIREKLGLTQAELAEAFGDSGPNVVSNIEIGFRKAGATKILVLRLLDNMPTRRASRLVQQLTEQNRQYRGKT